MEAIVIPLEKAGIHINTHTDTNTHLLLRPLPYGRGLIKVSGVNINMYLIYFLVEYMLQISRENPWFNATHFFPIGSHTTPNLLWCHSTPGVLCSS